MEFQPDVLYQLLQSDLNLQDALPLTSDLTVGDARKSALLASILKKWEPKSSLPLEQKAIATFLECNAECSTVSIQMDGFVGDAIKRARHYLADLFETGPAQSAAFGLHEFCGAGSCGPGTSLGTKRTDFLGKMFESTLTTTEIGLYRFYSSQLSPRWRAANDLRAACHGVELRRGSQLSTVPKNRDTNRTICTEPSLNMFFQLGAGASLEKLLLAGHNIDLSKQPDRNKAMARSGSVSGEFSTIDLRSASDTISTTLVEYLLPRSLFSNLDLIRSKEVSIGGEWVPLQMFSSMGNGFTFPLQTLIFATLVRAAYEVLGIQPNASNADRNYSVFGDDIICTKHAYSFVCQVLTGCGFHVNDTKSFNVGPFRESCGGDYFKGFDIRAVYLRKIAGSHDLYSLFNRLVRWSAKYGIYLGGALNYIRGLVKFRPIPFDEQDTAGIKIPSCRLLNTNRDRNGALYYTAYVAVPRVFKLGDAGGENPEGAIICAIGGYIRNHQVGVRSTTTSWKVVRRKTPSWDYVPYAGLTSRDYDDALIGLFIID
nr:MAG: hypothetical protein 3 [Leviviridae sp.]